MPLQETESCRWFATEVQPHERSLRSYLRARFPSVADVDDLVQETYARLVRAHRVGRARITRGYIFVTARNLALDLLRRRAAVPFEDLDENTASFVVAESADVAETVSHNQELALRVDAAAGFVAVSEVRHSVMPFLSTCRVCTAVGVALARAALLDAQPTSVARFARHEVSLCAAGSYGNPYKELTAEAVLTEPDRRTVRQVPLFWDGGRTWRFRFAPDELGTWKWLVKSADVGLDGKSGSFECVPSQRHGSFQPLGRSPYHFQYQNGEKVWFLADTAWAYLTDNEEEQHDRAAAERYVANRARQGFNAIHVMLLNEAGWGNRQGPPWTDIAAEKINPGYFQEAEQRIAFANAQNVVVGVALAWAQKGRREPYAWGRLPTLAARERYARYATARYAAYNVYFLVSGEWQGEIRNRKSTEEEIRREFVRLGDVVRASDAHGRMIGIHPLGRYRVTREFNAAAKWMSFGDYQQNYQQLHASILESRTVNKPVVNSEYAYWLRANNRAGVVDKPHSYTLEDIRAATWDIAMAGGYLVAGFGSTYMGGHRHPTPFLPDDPKNAPWAEQIGFVKSFFTSLDFDKLQPHDELVTSPAARTEDRAGRLSVDREIDKTQAPLTTYWCLADPERCYVAYVRGTIEPITLALGSLRGASAAQFDPRTGARTPLPAPAGDRYEYRPPDARDWALVITARLVSPPTQLTESPTLPKP